jgi:tetratricopeptide (TPR) repeat protein
MGSIYRARDRLTGERVAVKMLLGGGKQHYERFVREARLLAELKHPTIVRYIAHGPTPSGDPFLAMEWLEGENLSQRLRNSEPSLGEALSIGTRVANALATAHARGIVHRDIKPANIFLLDGDPAKTKLLDFGIAQITEGTYLGTQTGMLMGTPGYMAPEQARGQKALDSRVDVFALGCVLYRCLSGSPPFPGTDLVAILAKLIFEEPPPLGGTCPELPGSLCSLVMAMLSKDPARRPVDGAAVAKVLREISGTVVDLNTTAQRRQTTYEAITTAEQRLMSVVVAGPDPSGAEGQDSAAWARVRGAIQPFGAEVATLADGSLVATLTATGELIDRASQAARCALAISAVLPNRAIVLATGRHLQGGQTPLGEVIDRAVLMLRSASAQARSGAPVVRVDEVTAGILDSRFELRGDSVSLYLWREREPLEPARTLLGRETPCFGRDRELTVLNATFAECAAEPVARVVLVTAAAGVGKSRIRHEFTRGIEARGAPMTILMGRGDPLGAGSPFRLLAQALRRELGVLEGEPDVVRRQKLRARLSRNVGAHNLGRVAEFLGELCGVSFPDEDSVQLRAARQDLMQMGDQMRRAFEDFLAAECARCPVLIVFDDLQWGDLPTVQWIDSALRNLHDRPIMVLAFARPDVRDLFPQLWVDRGLQHIHLSELTPKMSERFVRSVLGAQVSPERVAAIVERAAGNAFFLEEMIRAVADGRADRLPETVLAVVQARLDQLEPDARRILRAASVFGKASWSGGILALLGGAPWVAHIGEWLEHLCAREVLTRRVVSRFPGEDELTFRNALVRDAAYAMLTDEDRVLAHRLAGEWLERAGETDASVLASHFELGHAPARALSWYTRAAEQALEGNDFAAALAEAERGIACGAAGPELGALALIKAEAHKWMGNNTEAKLSAMQSTALLPRATPRWLASVAVLATVSAKMGHNDQLTTLAGELHTVPAGDAPAAYATAAARVAIQLLHTGFLSVADELLLVAEGAARGVTSNEPAMSACISQARAIRSMFEGDVGGFTQLTEAAAENFERAGDFRSAGTQRANVAYGYIEFGAYADAERVLRDVVATADRMGLKDLAAGSRHNLGIALARQGNFKEARAVESAALKVALAQSNRRLECGCRTYLSTIFLLADDPVGAEREARAALEILAVAPPMRAHAFGTLSKALLAQGRAREALDAASEAVELMRSHTGVEEGESLVRVAYIESFLANGLTSEVPGAVAQACERLFRRSTHIRDSKWRSSFLNDVPDNARILELSRAWLGTAS